MTLVGLVSQTLKVFAERVAAYFCQQYSLPYKRPTGGGEKLLDLLFRLRGMVVVVQSAEASGRTSCVRGKEEQPCDDEHHHEFRWWWWRL